MKSDQVIRPFQATNYQEKYLRKVHITVRSAKNDEDGGEGYKYSFYPLQIQKLQQELDFSFPPHFEDTTQVRCHQECSQLSVIYSLRQHPTSSQFHAKNQRKYENV